MITIRAKGEVILQGDIPGAQAIASDQAVLGPVPFNGVIRAILAALDTAGTVSGTQVTDIKKNGVSIFSGATKMNFAAASLTPSYGAFSVNPTAVAKGDTLTLHTTAVHGTPGKNLAVCITIRRGRLSPKGTDTNSISVDSDNT